MEVEGGAGGGGVGFWDEGVPRGRGLVAVVNNHRGGNLRRELPFVVRVASV